MNHMAAEPVAAAPPAPGAALPSRAMRAYILLILVLTGSMSIIDRQIMTILVQPIKTELRLSDTQMGFLTGLTFALVYATLCVPAARLADRVPRSRLIAVAMAFWSVMTMFCGMAQGAVQLFLARFGVGFGEAGANPAMQALVGDLFPRKARATAMAVLLLSSPIGMGVGLGLGGQLLQAYGWRTTFIVAGLPGLVLAPLILLTFPRVRKGAADGVLVERPSAPIGPTLRALLATGALVNMALAATFQALISSGVTTWVPAFLERSHHLSHAAIGAGLGAALGTGSLIGHIAGGPLVDWLGRHDLRWQFWLPMVTAPLSGLCAASAFVAPIAYVFPLMGLQLLFGGLFAGPMIAVVMNLAPITGRATASACVILVLNLFGLGLGPQLIGVMSDLLAPAYGTESLRIALLLSCLIAIPASFFFWRASRTYRADLARVDAFNAGAA